MYSTVENFSRPLAVVPIAHSTAATIPVAARAIAPARRGFERMLTSGGPIAAITHSDHRRAPASTPPPIIRDRLQPLTDCPFLQALSIRFPSPSGTSIRLLSPPTPLPSPAPLSEIGEGAGGWGSPADSSNLPDIAEASLPREGDARMKIARARARLIDKPGDHPLVIGLPPDGSKRQFVTLEMETDDGVEGIGITFFGGSLSGALKSAVQTLADMTIGEDPMRTGHIVNKLRPHVIGAGPAGIATLALSAVDIALWDIKGKALGQSVNAMLGDRKSTRLNSSH